MKASCLVVDFSSVFTALIHELLQYKISQLTMPASTCHGIRRFLLGRREKMRLGKAKSNTLTITTGEMQGCFSTDLLPVQKHLHSHLVDSSGILWEVCIPTVTWTPTTLSKICSKHWRWGLTWERAPHLCIPLPYLDLWRLWRPSNSCQPQSKLT